jgi:hypothetical protein
VSRLDYAPKLKEIQVTDIQKGLGVFTPKPDKPVSFAALKATLKSAGYTLDSADITVAGTLAKDDQGWAIIVQPPGQRLALQGPNVDQALAGSVVGARIEITGDWKTVGAGATTFETISPRAGKMSRVFVTCTRHHLQTLRGQAFLPSTRVHLSSRRTRFRCLSLRHLLLRSA